MQNIYNPTTGQKGYQVPGQSLQSGWQWITNSTAPAQTQTYAPPQDYSSVISNYQNQVRLGSLTQDQAYQQALTQTGGAEGGTTSQQQIAKQLKEGIYSANRVVTPVYQSTTSGAGSTGVNGYTGNSIVDYLNSIGQPSDYNSRATLAAKQGINNYAGTANQNTQILNTLRSNLNLSQAQPPGSASGINQVPSGPGMPVLSPYAGDISAASAANSGADKLFGVLQQQMQDLQAQREKAAAQQQVQTQSFLDKITGSKSTAESRSGAFQSIGVDPAQYFADEQSKIAEIGKLTEDYNAVKASKDAQIAQSYDKLASTSFINNQIAQIERNAAPKLSQMSADINSKAAVLQAVQGRFNEAQKFVDQAVQDATADKKYSLDLFTTFYQINQDSINRLDTKYQNAFNQALDIAKTQWEQQVKDKTEVGKLMVSNPQAGISMSDNLTSAYAKIGSRPKADEPKIFGSAETGYYQSVFDPVTNRYVNRPVTSGTSGVNTPSNFLDIMQRSIDAGASAEQAAREAAAVSENAGIPVDQKTVNSWTTQAKGLSKTPVPVINTPISKLEQTITELKKGNFLRDSDIRVGLRNRGYSETDINNSSVGSIFDRVGAASSSFFSNLFGG